MLESWLDAVVWIEQGSAACAGVHVGGGRVATAYHCVAPGGRPEVTTRGGKRAVGRVVAASSRDDLAVIEVALELPALGLGVAPPLGADVWALGHPLATAPSEGLLAGTLSWSSSAGSVSAVGERALQITAPLNPGNSGGPVVDAEGRVVGIVSRRLPGDGLGFAVRAERLAELLAREPRGLSPLGGTVGIDLLVHGLTGEGAVVAAGGRLEVTLRDRFVWTAGAAVPWSPRWTAARFGEASAEVLESAAGPRLRLGRGAWTLRVDGFGGVAAVQRWTRPDADPLDLSTRTVPTWVVGGGIAARHVGFEVAALPAEGLGRASVVLRWPGVVRVF